MNREELLAEYHRLAKKADRRLRELERISEEQDFKDATKWAYAKAMKDIEHRFGEGETRFDKKIPKDWNLVSANAALNEVKSFLEMPSSTKTGIIETYKKRADTLNKKYPGLDVTWQQLAKLFENGTFDKLLDKFTSAQVFKQIAKRKKESGEIKKEIRKADDKIHHVSDNKVFDVIIEQLKNTKLTINDLV